jgi:hypothetical protein
VLLTIPFPYDEGTAKSTTGRKLQLERAGVYMVLADSPVFNGTSFTRK